MSEPTPERQGAIVRGARRLLSMPSAFVRYGASMFMDRAAATHGRAGGFQAGAGGPNTATRTLDLRRDRSRSLVYNEGLVDHAVKDLVANIVGCGIKPICRDPALNQLFERSTDYMDSMGQGDFYGMQPRMTRAMIIDGDAFGRMRDRREEDVPWGIVPLQIQCLEADHVPTSKTEILPNGHRVVAGVERDLIGRKAAYWMHRAHPKDSLRTGFDELVRVPAVDVLHLADFGRLGDERGDPWLSRAIVRCNDVADYDDAEMVRKRVAGMFGGFIRTPGGRTSEVTKIMNGMGQGWVEGDGTGVVQSYEPGTFVPLGPGEEVDIHNPSDTSGAYQAWMKVQREFLATSMHVMPTALGNWDIPNERIYRAMTLEFSRHVAMWQHHLLVFQFCRPFWDRFISRALTSGLWVPKSDEDLISALEPTWQTPARGHIHPVQEVEALIKAVRAGFITRREAAAMYGMNVEEIDAIMAADYASAKANDVWYDTMIREKGDDPVKGAPGDPADA